MILFGFDLLPASYRGLIFSYLQYPMYVAAILLGFYPAYWSAKRLDRRGFHSDLSIWMLRLASLGLFGFSLLVLFSISVSSVMTMTMIKYPSPMIPILIIFLQSLFFGLLLLSGFMMFKFRMRSGVIVYRG